MSNRSLSKSTRKKPLTPTPPVIAHPSQIARTVPARPRVLVVVSPIWEESASKILKGIALYQQEHTTWDIHWDNEGLSLNDPNWFNRDRWEGVISRHTNYLQVHACARLGIPLIDVNDAQNYPDIPNIALDNTAVGELGGEHFIDRGFRQFAFCGFSSEAWSRARSTGFQAAVGVVGHECHLLETIYPGYYNGACTPDWHVEEIERIRVWLLSLPRSTGVMACSDYRAIQILQAARLAGLKVPDDIAVLGANDDEARCELATPPLSSVATNHRRSGYVAAEALDRLLQHRSLDGLDLVINPLEVVTRQSTDILAVDDKKIAIAVRHIHQNACKGLTVDDISRHVGVARTQLEEKFRKFLGRSPHAEIRRVQLARIRELLQDTDLPLNAISDLTGFTHPEYLIVFFKREMNESPGRYRKKLRFQANLARTFACPTPPLTSPPSTVSESLASRTPRLPRPTKTNLSA